MASDRSIAAAFRAIISDRPRLCPACGRKPDGWYDGPDLRGDRIEVARFFCHGSRAVIELTRAEVERSRDDAWVDRVAREVREMFKADASPDMMELLRYNASEAWA